VQTRDQHLQALEGASVLFKAKKKSEWGSNLVQVTQEHDFEKRVVTPEGPGAPNRLQVEHKQGQLESVDAKDDG
jgi:hypothetical protein